MNLPNASSNNGLEEADDDHDENRNWRELSVALLCLSANVEVMAQILV